MSRLLVVAAALCAGLMVAWPGSASAQTPEQLQAWDKMSEAEKRELRRRYEIFKSLPEKERKLLVLGLRPD